MFPIKNYGALETGVHGLHLATNVLLDGGYQLFARHWPAAGLVMVELQMFGKATSSEWAKGIEVRLRERSPAYAVHNLPLKLSTFVYVFGLFGCSKVLPNFRAVRTSSN